MWGFVIMTLYAAVIGGTACALVIRAVIAALSFAADQQR